VAGPDEQDHPCLTILVRLPQRLRERCKSFAIERILPPRPIERNRRNPALTTDDNLGLACCFAHKPSLACPRKIYQWQSRWPRSHSPVVVTSQFPRRRYRSVMPPLLDRLHIRLPIIQAPMAGGPDTPALAAAVCNAGALGSLGCGYLTGTQIDTLAATLR